jgi:hypothetical protein
MREHVMFHLPQFNSNYLVLSLYYSIISIAIA